MTKSKKIALALVAAATALSVSGVAVARASESADYPPIVDKLVERFGLNPTEVQEVFTEARQERRQEMKAKAEERLAQAVADGTITEEQKNAILAKQAEHQENRPEPGEMKGMSQEERQALREQHREEMQAWAEENGLDHEVMKELMPGGGKRAVRRHFRQAGLAD